MNLLNVSTVFGPTLVRNPHPSAGLLMNDISAGNAVVEMLCQHVSLLYQLQGSREVSGAFCKASWGV